MLKITLTPAQFLGLKAMVEAFEVANEDNVSSATLEVKPFGKISWAEGGDVEIEIEEGKP